MEEAKTKLLGSRDGGGGERRVSEWEEEEEQLWRRTWVELKKLWVIAGPAVFTRVSMFGIFVIAQAFIGRIGDVQMAALALVFHVFVRFSIGILVIIIIFYNKGAPWFLTLFAITELFIGLLN